MPIVVASIGNRDEYVDLTNLTNCMNNIERKIILRNGRFGPRKLSLPICSSEKVIELDH